MPQNAIKQSIKEISEAERVVNTNMSDIPFSRRPGFEVLQQTARDSIVGLRKSIEEQTIPTRLVGIFAVGDQDAIKNTAAFLRENRGIVVDAEAYYREIAKDVEASMVTNRIFQITQHGIVISHVRNTAIDFGIKELNAVPYKEQNLPDAQATINFVRSLTRDSIGDHLNVLQIRQQLVDTVIANSLAAKSVPVLVTNSTLEERTALGQLFSKSAVVEFDADFTPTRSSITTKFNNVSK